MVEVFASSRCDQVLYGLACAGVYRRHLNTAGGADGSYTTSTTCNSMAPQHPLNK
jgi:hypothetical protein